MCGAGGGGAAPLNDSYHDMNENGHGGAGVAGGQAVPPYNNSALGKGAVGQDL